MKFKPLLLYSGENTNANFAYFSGLGMRLYDHSFLYLEGKKKILIVSKMNEKLGRKNFKGKILVYGDLKKILEKLLKGKTIGIDGENLNFRIYNFIKKLCKVKDASQELLETRMRKTPKEISKLKKACKITKEIIYSVDLKKCKTEKDVEKELLFKTAELGLEHAFKPIVASGKNTSFPHYTPGDYKLKDLVLIDYGVKFEGYCGDNTRCFFLKNGPWEKDYELVKQIVGEIKDHVSECKNSGELAKFTTGLYQKYKLPKELHSLGHGVGLELHEFPHFGRKSTFDLNNTVFTIEPGIYRKNWGTRFEDVFYFHKEKVRVL